MHTYIYIYICRWIEAVAPLKWIAKKQIGWNDRKTSDLSEDDGLLGQGSGHISLQRGMNPFCKEIYVFYYGK